MRVKQRMRVVDLGSVRPLITFNFLLSLDRLAIRTRYLFTMVLTLVGFI